MSVILKTKAINTQNFTTDQLIAPYIFWVCDLEVISVCVLGGNTA